MSDTLEIFGRIYPAAEGIKAYDSDGNLLTFVKDNIPKFTFIYDNESNWNIVSATCNKTYSECVAMYNNGSLIGANEVSSMADSSSSWSTEVFYGEVKKEENKIIFTSFISGQALYDIVYHSNGSIDFIDPSSYQLELEVAQNGTYYPQEGAYIGVRVNVPTGTPRTSSDLTVSGATVTIPAGLYSTQATKSVASGTEGTPIATKGTVSNHQVSVTPSVTNTTGYITGGTKTGTAVTVTASELTSGNKAITDNGNNIDVVEYSTVSVNVEPEDFIITLSYNSTTEIWEPDCTWAELSDAHTNGKNIYITCSNLDVFVEGEYLHYNGDYHYNYYLLTSKGFEDNSYSIIWDNYDFSANGLEKRSESYTYYDTYDADVIASQVPNGKVFYTSTGKGVGTSPIRSSTDLTVSGATVTAPAGFYSSDATKTVASGSATTPATTITANPSISVSSSGLITATASATQSVTPTISAGYVSSGTAGTVTVSGSNTSQLDTQAGSTITPTESVQTAVASGKYTTGDVKIGAISSTYVGSGIAQNDSDDLTVSGATVTAPSGYYATSVSKSVASGSAGTPSASKGTVSNHSISVTPSVTNTTGYITGGTKTGTAVTVTASELASGNKAISSNGTDIDVVGYSTVSVDVQPSLQSKTGINPTTSSQTISPDSGYYGLSSVQINAMPTMTLPTSASSSATSGYTSKATIGRSTSAQYINIPTGYNSAGAYYLISATPNGTVTAPSTISGTSATVSTGTNTLTLTKTVSVTPNVTTAGYISSGTAGNSSVSLTASVNIRSSSDLTVSGDTVTAPAGYYGSAASKAVSSMTLPTSASASATSGYTSKATISRSTSDQYINIPTGYNSSGAYYKINAVANGTEGTPTATKGTVSNHQVSVTPSVTNTTGYITGGTKTGTAVTVTASELASGNKAITQNGTGIDVVGYSTVSVDVSIESGDFARRVIVPQQTIACSTNLMNQCYFGLIQNGTPIDASKQYIVTFDGTEYTCEGYVPEANATGVGDIRVTQTNSISFLIEPFFIEHETNTGNYYFCVRGSGTHTVKVEELTFIDSGTNISSIYTGSTTPASSLGVNGDIYIKTTT